jgi:hypothetical protein
MRIKPVHRLCTNRRFVAHYMSDRFSVVAEADMPHRSQTAFRPRMARNDSGFHGIVVPVGSSEVRVGLGAGCLAMSNDFLPALRPEHPVWNKGRIIGQKRPLLPKHVWSIRVRLEMTDNRRDLALFNMAIDSKRRGCDLVCLKVRDVFAAGRVKERTSVTQSKTGKPVRFEITETTRLSLERWIADPEMLGMECLWPSL